MTLQINLKQIKADGASNNHVLAWSNTSNSWTSANASSLVVAANSSVAGVIRIVDSYTNTSTTIAASANAVTTAYNTAVTAQNMAANAYSNAASVAATAYSNAVATASTDASSKAATAYSNAAAQAATLAATAYANAYYWANSLASSAYSNAVTYAASNTYVNATFAPLASPTFTGTLTAAVVSQGNTTVTGFANVSGTLQVGGQLTVAGNLIINGTTTTVNTTSINVTDSLLYLATNNEISDTLDIGFAAHYNNGAGANGHTGLIRSATTKKYYLFQNYQPEFYANNNVDVANTGTGIQMADLVVGNLVANSTLTVTGVATFSSNAVISGGAVSININRASSDGDVATFLRANTSVGSIGVTSTGTTYNTTSDYRLKTDVQPITDGKERILKLRPVRHGWVSNNSVVVDGFLAHQAQESGFEYAVTGTKDGDVTQTMDYGRISPAIVAALQDAFREIDELRQKLGDV